MIVGNLIPGKIYYYLSFKKNIVAFSQTTAIPIKLLKKLVQEKYLIFQMKMN